MKKPKAWYHASSMKSVADEWNILTGHGPAFVADALIKIRDEALRGKICTILVPPEWMKPEDEGRWAWDTSLALARLGYSTTRVKVEKMGPATDDPRYMDTVAEWSVRAEWEK